MKYNGKEVTEDFADSVRSRVTQNTDKECEPETWEVMEVLQAAEEVFAKMHQDEFYPGQKVKDDTGREGEIILHPTSTHIWARFGSTKVMLNKSRLTKIEEAQEHATGEAEQSTGGCTSLLPDVRPPR